MDYVLKRSPTTETPISTSDHYADKGEDAPYGYCPKCGARGEYRERHPNGDDTCVRGHSYPSRDAVKSETAAFDPAPGVDLSDAYADRMAVRVERDEINKAGRDALPGGSGLVLITPEGSVPLEDEEEVLPARPGRQTSPELAALASKWSKLTGEELLAQAMAGRSGEVAEVVRRLAASVLSQVNG